jgi:hypothetical protein
MSEQATQGEPSLEPVQADDIEIVKDRWTRRLVAYLRIMAAVSLVKGLYHWSVVCGISPFAQASFDTETIPYQTATVFFAVIDLVAAVGLWLAAPWGAVVWLTSIISMAAVEILFPQIYGGQYWVVMSEIILLIAYLILALQAAREKPP